MESGLIIVSIAESISHYTDAVVAGSGRTIYISGQGSIDESGRLVGRGDITAQTRKTLDSMKIALAAAGIALLAATGNAVALCPNYGTDASAGAIEESA